MAHKKLHCVPLPVFYRFCLWPLDTAPGPFGDLNANGFLLLINSEYFTIAHPALKITPLLLLFSKLQLIFCMYQLLSYSQTLNRHSFLLHFPTEEAEVYKACLAQSLRAPTQSPSVDLGHRNSPMHLPFPALELSS